MAPHTEKATGTKSSKAPTKAANTGGNPTGVAKTKAKAQPPAQKSRAYRQMERELRRMVDSEAHVFFNVVNCPLDPVSGTFDLDFADKSTKIMALLEDPESFWPLVRAVTKKRTGYPDAKANLDDLDNVYEDLIKAEAARRGRREGLMAGRLTAYKLGCQDGYRHGHDEGYVDGMEGVIELDKLVDRVVAKEEMMC